MGNTTLTHKLRNPKDLSKWLDIWTADVTDVNNYIITPSEHWEIPANQITDYTYIPEPTQDNPNPDPITEKNTTIENPEGNHIAITNNDGSISEGPEIDEQNGSPVKFLNEQGQWVANSYNLKIQNYKLKYDDDDSYLPTFILDGINSSNKIPVETVGFIDAYVSSARHSYEIRNETTNPTTGEPFIEIRRVIEEIPTLTLATKHIDTEDILNGAITEDKLADNSVTENKLADNSVTENKLADECVTIDKIAQSAIDAIDTWQPNLKNQNGYVVQPPELEEDAKPMIWAAAPDQDPKWMTIIEAADISATDVKSETFKQYVNGTALIITGAPIISVTAEVDPITGDIAHVEPIKFEQAVSGTALTLVEKPIIRIEVIRTKETNNEESSG